MNVRNSLPSAIYRMSSMGTERLNDIPRDNRIGMAIEMSIDRIFMAMYCRRSIFGLKSVEPIYNAILKTRPRIAEALTGITLNSLEGITLDRLESLGHVIAQENTLVRLVPIDTIETLLYRIPCKSDVITSLVRVAKFVLSVAGQFDYEDSSFVVPHIRILDCDAAYAKGYTTIESGFNLTTTKGNNINDMWYRIFGGVVFSFQGDNPYTVMEALCSTINIGTVPDITTGIGLNRFTYESFVASDLTKRFVGSGKGIALCDDGLVKTMMTKNNSWMSKNFSVIYNSVGIGSLEAAKNDVAWDDYSKPPDGTDNFDDPTSDGSSTAPDKSEDASSDAASDPNQTGIDDTEDTAGDPNLEDPEAADNLDTTSETPEVPEMKARPVLLGLNLALPQNETLDDFMYKLSVAKFIDTVIEFNHDELPLDTVTLLTQWKSTLLFLTDAGETVRLLKELNIKMK